jgi:hypothetical protein
VRERGYGSEHFHNLEVYNQQKAKAKRIEKAKAVREAKKEKEAKAKERIKAARSRKTIKVLAKEAEAEKAKINIHD